ncbi:MAG: 50S ribosomal protein L15 [Puniceicoccales bacterium]|jgi:large subunit ribosomal protein L15|nr:50S ribosomal protein L15 [Puniceicoccales bacterium]
MKLNNLVSSRNARRVRVGRGESSGLGRTSGRGNKGARARSGYRASPVTSGIPWYRKLPMRGFSNYKFRKTYVEVPMRKLLPLIKSGFVEIDLPLLIANKIVRADTEKIKCIGRHDITRAVTVLADAFSEGCAACICAAGGHPVVLKASTC